MKRKLVFLKEYDLFFIETSNRFGIAKVAQPRVEAQGDGFYGSLEFKRTLLLSARSNELHCTAHTAVTRYNPIPCLALLCTSLWPQGKQSIFLSLHFLSVRKGQWVFLFPSPSLLHLCKCGAECCSCLSWMLKTVSSLATAAQKFLGGWFCNSLAEGRRGESLLIQEGILPKEFP